MQERVRAIILENGKLLTFKRFKKGKTYWVLPGGGVEKGERFDQALQRECREELGVDIAVGQKLLEYVYQHEKYGPQHETFFAAEIVGGELGTGDGPEFQPNSGYEGTREIQWLDIDQIALFDVKPQEAKEKLSRLFE